MAVEITGYTNGFLANSSAPVNVSHTVAAGSDRVMYVVVYGYGSADGLVSGSCAFGGVSMGAPIYTDLARSNHKAYVWRLLAPAEGTANVTVSPSGTSFLHIHVFSASGVDQTTPNGTVVSTSNGSQVSPVTTTVTMVAGGRALDVVSRREVSETLTPDVAQTALASTLNATSGSSRASSKTGSGSVSMSWTLPSIGSTVHVVVPMAAVSGGSGDTTAPTLSSPTGAATGTTTATATVTTDEPNGTLYAVVTTSATQPSVSQIKAGQNSGGTAAAFATSQAITTTGVKTVSATGLTAGTTYYAHFVHADSAGNDSARASSGSFTTTSAGDITAPTLTSPTGTATGSTTASGTVSTNEGNGVLYFLASTNATETVATVKAAGGTQALSTSGTKTVAFSGLSGGTTYYAHYVHRDAAGNDSARVSSASFTTSAPTSVGFDFHSAPGMIFGDLAGALTGIARQASVAMVLRVYNASTGALVLTSGTLTTGSDGRLARYENAGLTVGVSYHLLFTRSSDGEVVAARMTAT